MTNHCVRKTDADVEASDMYLRKWAKEGWEVVSMHPTFNEAGYTRQYVFLLRRTTKEVNEI